MFSLLNDLWGATQRRSLILAVTACFLGLPDSDARGELPESLVARLGQTLRRERPRRVLVFTRAVPKEAADNAAANDLKQIEQRLQACCREASVETAGGGALDGLEDLSLNALPDPADLRGRLVARDVGAILVAIRKRTGSAVAYRVVLMDAQKVLWSGRLTVRCKPATGDAGASATGGATIGARSGGSPAFPSSAFGQSGLLVLGGIGGTAPSTIFGPEAAGRAFGDGLGVGVLDLPDVNARILEFARSHVGQQVGDGQCSSLAVAALAVADARPPAGYDFGEEVTLADLLPGDMLYFQDAWFLGQGFWLHLGDPHHVALVGEVNGSVVAVYQQNMNGNLTVRRDVLDLTSLRSGEITAYRAVAQDRAP